ncbi:MAG: hypothetical protein Q9M39_01010 [Sulfurovum sp.]|nr:hypothetical protein [Sulfurovum sp.]
MAKYNYGAVTMKILLINTNPVVSSLLVMCTRDVELLLDEVADVNEVKDVEYDLVFVDDDSYVDAVDTFFEKRSIQKKIFISYVEEGVVGFDESIQKPFLPSQIHNVIESVKKDFILEEEDDDDDEFEFTDKSVLSVLDEGEIAKIKALLEMDDEEESIDFLNEDEVHFRKVEVIKEQLISEGLEILDEDEIIQSLSTQTKEKKEDKQAILECSKKERQKIETAVTQALAGLKSKGIKKLLKGKKIKLKIKIEDKN